MSEPPHHPALQPSQIRLRRQTLLLLGLAFSQTSLPFLTCCDHPLPKVLLARREGCEAVCCPLSFPTDRQYFRLSGYCPIERPESWDSVLTFSFIEITAFPKITAFINSSDPGFYRFFSALLLDPRIHSFIAARQLTCLPSNLPSSPVSPQHLALIRCVNL